MGNACLAFSGGDASLESQKSSGAGDFAIRVENMFALMRGIAFHVAAEVLVAACAIGGYAVFNRQEVLFVAGL